MLQNEEKNKYTLKEFGVYLKSKHPEFEKYDDEDVAKIYLKNNPKYEVIIDRAVKKKEDSQGLSSESGTASNGFPIPGEQQTDNNFVQADNEPYQKPSFDEWYATVPKDKNDTTNYDLKAAYENMPYASMKNFAEGDAHLPDTYKKPNHPTFSNESIYSTPDTPGGEWTVDAEGNDVFKPTKFNIKQAGGVGNLKKYFDKYEPGVKLDFTGVDKSVYQKHVKNDFHVLSDKEVTKLSGGAKPSSNIPETETPDDFQDLTVRKGDSPSESLAKVEKMKQLKVEQEQQVKSDYIQAHSPEGKQLYDEMDSIVGNNKYEFFTDPEAVNQAKEILLQKHGNFNERAVDEILSTYMGNNKDAVLYNKGINDYLTDAEKEVETANKFAEAAGKKGITPLTEKAKKQDKEKEVSQLVNYNIQKDIVNNLPEIFSEDELKRSAYVAKLRNVYSKEGLSIADKAKQADEIKLKAFADGVTGLEDWINLKTGYRQDTEGQTKQKAAENSYVNNLIDEYKKTPQDELSETVRDNFVMYKGLKNEASQLEAKKQQLKREYNGLMSERLASPVSAMLGGKDESYEKGTQILNQVNKLQERIDGLNGTPAHPGEIMQMKHRWEAATRAYSLNESPEVYKGSNFKDLLKTAGKALIKGLPLIGSEKNVEKIFGSTDTELQQGLAADTDKGKIVLSHKEREALGVTYPEEISQSIGGLAQMVGKLALASYIMGPIAPESMMGALKVWNAKKDVGAIEGISRMAANAMLKSKIGQMAYRGLYEGTQFQVAGGDFKTGVGFSVVSPITSKFFPLLEKLAGSKKAIPKLIGKFAKGNLDLTTASQVTDALDAVYEHAVHDKNIKYEMEKRFGKNLPEYVHKTLVQLATNWLVGAKDAYKGLYKYDPRAKREALVNIDKSKQFFLAAADEIDKKGIEPLEKKENLTDKEKETLEKNKTLYDHMLTQANELQEHFDAIKKVGPLSGFSDKQEKAIKEVIPVLDAKYNEQLGEYFRLNFEKGAKEAKTEEEKETYQKLLERTDKLLSEYRQEKTTGITDDYFKEEINNINADWWEYESKKMSEIKKDENEQEQEKQPEEQQPVNIDEGTKELDKEEKPEEEEKKEVKPPETKEEKLPVTTKPEKEEKTEIKVGDKVIDKNGEEKTISSIDKDLGMAFSKREDGTEEEIELPEGYRFPDVGKTSEGKGMKGEKEIAPFNIKNEEGKTIEDIKTEYPMSFYKLSYLVDNFKNFKEFEKELKKARGFNGSFKLEDLGDYDIEGNFGSIKEFYDWAKNNKDDILNIIKKYESFIDGLDVDEKSKEEWKNDPDNFEMNYNLYLINKKPEETKSDHIPDTGKTSEPKQDHIPEAGKKVSEPTIKEAAQPPKEGQIIILDSFKTKTLRKVRDKKTGEVRIQQSYGHDNVGKVVKTNKDGSVEVEFANGETKIIPKEELKNSAVADKRIKGHFSTWKARSKKGPSTRQMIAMSSPPTLRDAALQYFISGNRMNTAEYEKELWTKKKAPEEFRRRSIWGLSEKAKTIDRIIEDIGDAYPHLKSTDWEHKLRGEIISVMMEHGGTKSMMDEYNLIEDSDSGDTESAENVRMKSELNMPGGYTFEEGTIILNKIAGKTGLPDNVVTIVNMYNSDWKYISEYVIPNAEDLVSMGLTQSEIMELKALSEGGDALIDKKRSEIKAMLREFHDLTMDDLLKEPVEEKKPEPPKEPAEDKKSKYKKEYEELKKQVSKAESDYAKKKKILETSVEHGGKGQADVNGNVAGSDVIDFGEGDYEAKKTVEDARKKLYELRDKAEQARIRYEKLNDVSDNQEEIDYGDLPSDAPVDNDPFRIKASEELSGVISDHAGEVVDTKPVNDIINPGEAKTSPKQKEYDNMVLEVANNWKKITGTDVVMVEKLKDVPERVKRNAERRGIDIKNALGFIDAKTGKVYVLKNNHTSVSEIVKTMNHEIVGHKGLKALLGKDWVNFLTDVYDVIPETEARRISAKYGTFDKNIIAEEWLAEKAESFKYSGVMNQMYLWLKQKVRNLFGITNTDEDIKILFNQSVKALRRENKKTELNNKRAENFSKTENAFYKTSIEKADADTWAKELISHGADKEEIKRFRLNGELTRDDVLKRIRFTLNNPETKMENNPFRVIGKIGVKQSGDQRNLDMLDNAIAMESRLGLKDKYWESDYNRKEKKLIMDATGWYRGRDGKWKLHKYDNVHFNTPKLLEKMAVDDLDKDYTDKDINVVSESMYSPGEMVYNVHFNDGTRVVVEDAKSSDEAKSLAITRINSGEEKRISLTSDYMGTLQEVTNPGWKIFKEYPNLKDYKVMAVTDEGGDYLASVITGKQGGEIKINRSGIKAMRDEGKSDEYINNELRNILLHETQHIIQRNEGFDRGSNSKIAEKEYKSAYQGAKMFASQILDIQNTPEYKQWKLSYNKAKTPEEYTLWLNNEHSAWKNSDTGKTYDKLWDALFEKKIMKAANGKAAQKELFELAYGNGEGYLNKANYEKRYRNNAGEVEAMLVESLDMTRPDLASNYIENYESAYRSRQNLNSSDYNGVSDKKRDDERDLFKSPTEDALPGIKQPKGTPDQMKAMLLKNGAKQAELDWMGFDEAFGDKKSVTKQEIEQWVKENKVELKEVVKGDKTRKSFRIKENAYGTFNVINSDGDVVNTSQTIPLAQNYINNYMIGGDGDTKYSQYKTPGGENYREYLITMPDTRLNKLSSEMFRLQSMPYTDEVGKRLKEITKEYKKLKEQGKVNEDYKSPHFDEPNIVVHARAQDFKDADNDKVLHIDEIQSDWGQEGKKKGFVKKPTYSIDDTKIEKGDFGWVILTDKEGNIIADEERLHDSKIDYTKDDLHEKLVEYANNDETNITGTIPDMPFKKTPQWAGLGLKRMVQEAAENGYDAITWTVGATQADRYDLSKQVDLINWIRNTDGTYDIYAKEIGQDLRKPVVLKVDENKLPDYVGKEVAKKIVNNEGIHYDKKGSQSGKLSGVDLKVGGEGMRAFYDQILPSTAKKLFKKYGAKVEEGELSSGEEGLHPFEAKIAFDNGENVSGYKNGNVVDLKTHSQIEDAFGNGYIIYTGDNLSLTKVWKMKLTPELIKEANGGFPMFKQSITPEVKGDFTPQTKEKIESHYEEIQKQSKQISSDINTFVKVVRSKYHLPKRLRDAVVSKEGLDIKGFYDPQTGTVYVVADKIPDTKTLREVILHESVGHKGLRAVLGKGYADILENVYKSMSEKDIKLLTDKGYDDTDVFLMAEEHLAHMAEKGQRLGYIDTAIAKLRQLIRQVFGLKYSDNDLLYLLDKSRKALANQPVQREGVNKPGYYESGTGVKEDGPVRYEQQKQINSPEFKKWFGDWEKNPEKASKVVDENGKPLVVYHATQSDFDRFDIKYSGKAIDFGTLGTGFYFGTNKENINNYARNLNSNTGINGGESIMPVYLSIKNPYEAKDMFEVSGDSKKEADKFKERLIRKGYDGVVFTNRLLGNDTFKWYVAFKPEQIKSATANTGSFDPTNPDIRFSQEKPGYQEKGEDNYKDTDSGKKGLELPEIVELIKRINGKYPEIRKNLGRALGKMSGVKGDPKSGKILLRKALFDFDENGEQNIKLVEAVLGHELGHLIDFLPEGLIKRGNILGHISAAEKAYRKSLLGKSKAEPGILTQKDRNRLRAEAKKQLKDEYEKSPDEILEEIITETPVYATSGISPEDIKAIWNDTEARSKYPDIYDYIARLSAAEKNKIMKKALKGIVDELMAIKFAKRVVGVEKHSEWVKRKVNKGTPPTKADIRKRFKEILAEEVRKRGMFQKETITEELKALTKWWHPFNEHTDPKYTEYRYSPEELYAEAVSVLLNDPDALKQRAPEFYKAFFNWFDVRKGPQQAYNEIQTLVSGGKVNIVKARNERMDKAFADAHQKRMDEVHKKNKKQLSKWNEFQRIVVDKNIPGYKLITKEVRPGERLPERMRVRNIIEQRTYLQEQTAATIDNIHNRIVRRAVDEDISLDDIGKILYNNRILNPNDRGDKANPGGIDMKAATDSNAEILSKYSDDQKKVIGDILTDFHNIIWETIEEAHDAGIFSNDVWENKIVPNKDSYVTFAVAEYIRGAFVSPYIRASKGTFKEIENPMYSTTAKIIALRDVINRQKAWQAFKGGIEFSGNNDIIVKRKKTGMQEPKYAEKEGYKILKVIEDGNAAFYEVPGYVKDMFDARDEGKDFSWLLKFSGANIFKNVFTPIVTKFSPGWMFYSNALRDSWRNLDNLNSILGGYGNLKPGQRASIPFTEYLPSIFKGLMQSVKYHTNNFGKGLDENTREMLRLGVLYMGDYATYQMEKGGDMLEPILIKNKMISKHRNYEHKWWYSKKGYEAVSKGFKYSGLGYIYKGYMFLGEVLESSTKFGGWDVLRKHFSPQDAAFFVRNYLGTPNSRAKGTTSDFFNTYQPFFNVIVQSLRTGAELATDKNTAKDYWLTHLFTAAIPGMAMGLLSSLPLIYDSFTDEEKDKWNESAWKNALLEYSKQYNKIADYHKLNYLSMPVMQDKEGNPYFIRLQLGEEQRFVFAFTQWAVRSLISKDLRGAGNLARLGTGMLPNSTPYFSMFSDWWSALGGVSPRTYLGTNVLNDRDLKSRGDAIFYKKMMKHTLDLAGLRIISNELFPDKLREFTEAYQINHRTLVSRIFRKGGQGEAEVYKELAAEVDEKNARLAGRVQEQVKDIISGKIKKDPKIDLLDPELKSDIVMEIYNGYEDRYGKVVDKRKMSSIKKLITVYLVIPNDHRYMEAARAIVFASSNESKAAIMGRLYDQLTFQDFIDLSMIFVKNGIMSKDVVKQVIIDKDFTPKKK